MKNTTVDREILERIKSGSGATSDTELGALLGVSQQAIYNARAKNKIPGAWIRKVAEDCNLSADWLLFGRENIRGNASGNNGEKSGDPDKVAVLEAKVAALERENTILVELKESQAKTLAAYEVLLEKLGLALGNSAEVGFHNADVPATVCSVLSRASMGGNGDNAPQHASAPPSVGQGND